MSPIASSTANIKPDHHAVEAEVQIKLKAETQTKGPGRNKYKESTPETIEEKNKQQLPNIITQSVNNLVTIT